MINKDPKLKQEAQDLANSFEGSKNGIIKALPKMKELAKNNNFVNDAVTALDKKPMIKMAINGMLMLNGTSVSALAKELNGQNTTPVQPVNSQPKQVSSFKDKLSKYK